MPLRRLQKTTTPNIVKSDLCVCVGFDVVEMFMLRLDFYLRSFHVMAMHDFFNSSSSSISFLDVVLRQILKVG